MKVYTASEIKQLETYTIEERQVTSLELMERAAKAIFNEIVSIKDSNTRVIVFAGSHNNGGDALAVSRLLSKAGYSVEVFLFNTKDSLSPECQANKEKLIQQCPEVAFHEISKKLDLPNITQRDLIIDGLFGIGLQGALTNSYALLVKFINNSNATVISIDIPSGMHSEDNSQIQPSQIVHADYTLSMTAVKPAFLLADCQEYIGECKILDIGIEETNEYEINTHYSLNEFEEIQRLLKPRNPFGHKGTFGHGLLIAGSYGMAGAAIIAAQAAMRSGMGKLTIHTAAFNNSILQTTVPQAIIHNDENNYCFTKAEDEEKYEAIAIGPGLGLQNETANAVIDQMIHSTKPLVIDADGINILAEHKGCLQQIPKGSILTPHPKEFMKLFGNYSSDYEMLNAARDVAINLQIIIILKSHYTAICCPSGHIYFNTTGNSGMATAGSGDALTGILLSLLAQGYPTITASRLGVYLHGMAGDLAAEELTEEGMNVMDLIQKIPAAFKELKKKEY